MKLVVLAFDPAVIQFAATISRLADQLFEMRKRGQDEM